MDGGPRQQIGAPEAGPRAGKAPNDNAIRAAGYGAVWHGQKSWNGVAILARGGEPMETRRGLPGDPDDTHSRYIEAAIVDPLVGCLYMPNGNPPPGPLNSRYFRPVRRKETRARRWDLQFESTSLQQTVCLSPAAGFEGRETCFPRGFGQLAWRPRQQKLAGGFDIASIGGNISVGPYSSTAVRLVVAPGLTGGRSVDL